MNIFEWFLSLFKRPKSTFTDLSHCEVPLGWATLRDTAWAEASKVLALKGFKPITRNKKIIIENGLQRNPKTTQWGRPDSTGFWYAGLSSGKYIKVVGDPNGKPYGERSLAIMRHECGESILTANNYVGTNDQRNKYLWSLGI